MEKNSRTLQALSQPEEVNESRNRGVIHWDILVAQPSCLEGANKRKLLRHCRNRGNVQRQDKVLSEVLVDIATEEENMDDRC